LAQRRYWADDVAGKHGEGDKISGMTLYATPAEALEAAGLRE
jgi:hypothetical protein